MKEIKPYYYKFEWKDRLITLCLVWDTQHRPKFLHVGYSVKIPEDKELEGLSEKIALGRTRKIKTRINNNVFGCYLKVEYNDEILEDKGFLKAIARNVENNIKKGNIIIKGIR